jgi:UDP-2-acetamido-3-amino-2,3-dideoxy-glucuronate N-acetyltransferase
MTIRIHPTAEVSPQAEIGDGTSIWHQAQIREGSHIGKSCILSKGVYIDAGVVIGDCVKIQNYVSVYHGVTIEDGVFIGPHVCFTNDLQPRAVNPDGTLKEADDWQLSPTLIRRGASLGANSTIRCGVTVGQWAMVGAGSVVTRDIPDYGLAWGNPARLHGFVCPCGSRLAEESRQEGVVTAKCPACGQTVEIPLQTWESAA